MSFLYELAEHFLNEKKSTKTLIKKKRKKNNVNITSLNQSWLNGLFTNKINVIKTLQTVCFQAFKPEKHEIFFHDHLIKYIAAVIADLKEKNLF